MTGKKGWRQKLKAAAKSAALLAGVAAFAAPGCLNRPLERVEPRTTTTIVERLTQSAVDKIDILLVIDNSRSMADKQAILEIAVPDLVDQLVNPPCIAADGSTTKPGPLVECPEGSAREFEPVVDIHIGVISSSLGGNGADACSPAASGYHPSQEDNGYLIARTTPDSQTNDVPTYQNLGFLVWDPNTDNPSHSPQGESDVATLNANLQSMVRGAGEQGCGYEAILEAWYRFLVNPSPHESVSINPETGQATLEGIDQAILDQRAQFLRPDSLLAIIMLTDENDCSIKGGDFFYIAAQLSSGGSAYRLPKPRAACATNPNDPCCRSCGQGPGEGCDTSNDDCDSGPLSQLEDAINLRCWDQKRRFGIDFLYPISRYTDGLREQTVPDESVSPATPVANPLFVDLNPEDGNSAVRDAGLVFIAGIVGVPWQSIARKNANGDPDLLAGQNAAGEPVGGFQSGAELATNGTWDVILGDPTTYHTDVNSLPTDPHMIEDVDPRPGLAGPGGGFLEDPIHGHEYTISQRDDLQYACIFDLIPDADCSTQEICDCKSADNDNPLCQDPNGGSFGTTQYYAKAYPGIRELQLLKAAAGQGIVGSICPAQQDNQNADDFGYRPAVNAIVERLKQELGGQCLPRTLTLDSEGLAPCIILEARSIADAAQCDNVCNSNGRDPIDQNHPAVQAANKDPISVDAAGNLKFNCYCQITQLTGDEQTACQQQEADPPGVHGWCYVDASTVPPTGNPAIVASCPPTEQRIIRFVNDGNAATGSVLFITCSGE